MSNQKEKHIEKKVIKAIDSIQKSSMKKTMKALNNVRKQLYHYINKVLPDFFKLEYYTSDQIIKHISKLKMEYAKRNQVENIQANITKLGIITLITYLIIPSNAKKLWRNQMNNYYKTFKTFLMNSLKHISKLDLVKFFKDFVKLGIKLIKNIFFSLKGKDTYVNKGLAFTLYVISSLMLIEIACLTKVFILQKLDML